MLGVPAEGYKFLKKLAWGGFPPTDYILVDIVGRTLKWAVGARAFAIKGLHSVSP